MDYVTMFDRFITGRESISCAKCGLPINRDNGFCTTWVDFNMVFYHIKCAPDDTLQEVTRDDA